MTMRWVQGRNDQGSALLVTLLAAVLLMGLAGGLAMAIMTEEAIEANHSRAVAALYAADGMLARAASDVAGRASWQAILHGTVPSVLRIGAAGRTLADGSSVGLVVVTADLQRRLDRERGAGAARWRLYAWGWHGELVADSDLDRQILVAAWVRSSVGGGRYSTTPSSGLSCVLPRSVHLGLVAQWKPCSAATWMRYASSRGISTARRVARTRGAVDPYQSATRTRRGPP
jgi:hypothetical protein